MNVIFIESTRTIMALHDTDGRPGDIIPIYMDGVFIENCVIQENK